MARAPALHAGGREFESPTVHKNNLNVLTEIEEKIENSGFYKYQGIAPEGFILVPVEVIEDLQDFDNWKEFKNEGFAWLDERSKQALKKY